MKPSDAFAHIAHRKTERVAIDALEGRITTSLLTPYPPGIPLLIPGEVFNRKIVDYLRFTREFNGRSRGSTPTCTGWSRTIRPSANQLLRGLRPAVGAAGASVHPAVAQFVAGCGGLSPSTRPAARHRGPRPARGCGIEPDGCTVGKSR